MRLRNWLIASAATLALSVDGWGCSDDAGTEPVALPDGVPTEDLGPMDLDIYGSVELRAPRADGLGAAKEPVVLVEEHGFALASHLGTISGWPDLAWVPDTSQLNNLTDVVRYTHGRCGNDGDPFAPCIIPELTSAPSGRTWYWRIAYGTCPVDATRTAVLHDAAVQAFTMASNGTGITFAERSTGSHMIVINCAAGDNLSIIRDAGAIAAGVPSGAIYARAEASPPAGFIDECEEGDADPTYDGWDTTNYYDAVYMYRAGTVHIDWTGWWNFVESDCRVGISTGNAVLASSMLLLHEIGHVMGLTHQLDADRLNILPSGAHGVMWPARNCLTALTHISGYNAITRDALAHVDATGGPTGSFQTGGAGGIWDSDLTCLQPDGNYSGL